MARKNQHTFSKRQREQKKAKKAAEKRARREERTNPATPLSATTEGYAPAGEDDMAASE